MKPGLAPVYMTWQVTYLSKLQCKRESNVFSLAISDSGDILYQKQ